MTRCIMVYPSFSDPHSSTRRNSGCPCSATAAWLSSSEWAWGRDALPKQPGGPAMGKWKRTPTRNAKHFLGKPRETKGCPYHSISMRLVTGLSLWTRKRTKYGSCLGYIWIPDVGNVEIHMADLTSPALLGILFAQASSNPKSCSGWFGGHEHFMVGCNPWFDRIHLMVFQMHLHL